MSDFKEGDTVRIKVGAFQNRFGVVTNANYGNTKLHVLVRLSGDRGGPIPYAEGELELVEQDLEAELKLAKEKVAELEKQISDHKNRFTNAKLKDVVEVDNSEYVKVAPNSWVLISGTERSGNATYVFRDKTLLRYAEEEDDFH